MPKYVVLRDSRLKGSNPSVFDTCRDDVHVITTSKTTPLQDVFDQINQLCEEHGQIETMFILCHGYAGSSANLLMSGDFGGQGLQLGKECVFHGNVNAWGHIENAVSNIIIYACAAANTEPGNEFTDEDGEYLMGALAIHTNADVYAADRIQWYNPNIFDFGAWEGNILKFSPSGAAPETVAQPPMDFSDLT